MVRLVYFCAGVLLCAAFALSATAAEKKTPVTELSTEKLEQRIADLESLMQKEGLLDMLQQLQDLKTEINNLRGQLEIKTNELEQFQKQQQDLDTKLAQFQKQQQDLNAELDLRLKKLEEKSASPPAVPAQTAPQVPTTPPVKPAPPAAAPKVVPGGKLPEDEMKDKTDAEKKRLDHKQEGNATGPGNTVSPPVTPSDKSGASTGAKTGSLMTLEKIFPDSPAKEKEIPGNETATGKVPAVQPPTATGDPLESQTEYQQAFKLLKQSQYDKAITAFQALLTNYPGGQYSDNAQYWIGEAYFVTRRYNEAINEYMKLLTDYPQSKKAPNSLLKIGYSYFELRHDGEAKKVLQYLIKRYPDTSAAQDAEKRLQQ